MIKNLKRAAAVLLSAVLLITSCSISGFRAFAAEIGGGDTDFIPDNYGAFISNEELGEIVSYGGYTSKAEYAAHVNDESVGAYYNPSFELCTDTGGNAIQYVSSADGVHSPGTYMYQININGQRAYCIQPGIHTSAYVSYSENAQGAWDDLSRNQRQAINTALCFGREGNFSAISSGTSIKSSQAYIATQVIIWEIVRGVRNPVAPFSLYAGESGYIGLFCAGGENPNIREAYNRIVRAMSTYTIVPSFAEYESSKAPLISLRATYNSLKRTWSYESVLPEGRYTLTELGQRKNGQYKIPERFAEPAPVDFEVSGEEYKLAQQNGYKAITINVANKCEGYISLTKTEEGGSEPVEGAVYGVFSDEDCMELIYQMPPTDKDGKSKSEIAFACNSLYYVKEIDAPVGYELSDTVYPVTIEPKAENEIIYELAVTDAPAPNPVEIRKTDITGTNEIEGAKLELRDSGGTLVEKWTSGKNAHVINDLAPGEYTLTETIPANGYVTAESITFTVQKGGEVTHVVMKDAPTKISIMKVDENNNPLSNAKLQILDGNGDTVVDTWTTDGNPYIVTGKLTVGKTYTLHEVKAPDGYLAADDVSFTVRDTSDVQSVRMIDQQTVSKFNKVDEQGNPVRGATLQLLKASGTKVAEWITDGTAKEIKGLTAGANYILRESKAPDGFVKAADVPFTVKSDGSITTVTMNKLTNVSAARSYSCLTVKALRLMNGLHRQAKRIPLRES